MAEETEKDVLSSLTQPAYPTAIYTKTTYPEFAVIREIDYKRQQAPGTGNMEELTFLFSNHVANIKLADSPYNGDFAALLKAVCGNFNFNLGESKPKKPYRTPLSLMGENLIYVIYKLSSTKHWQFSREGPPITIGETAKESGTYYDAHRVDDEGNADRGSDKKFIRDDCRVAYFIVDGAEAVKQAKCYSHPINLHVDLIWTLDGQPRYLPVIIDPDVRYPGGSG